MARGVPRAIFHLLFPVQPVSDSVLLLHEYAELGGLQRKSVRGVQKLRKHFYQGQGAQTFAPNPNIQPQVNTTVIDGNQPGVQDVNQGSDKLILVENNKESIVKKIINIITGIFKKKSQ